MGGFVAAGEPVARMALLCGKDEESGVDIPECEVLSIFLEM